MSKRKKLLISVLIIILLISVSIVVSREYKNKIGGYDLYTVLNIYLEFNKIVEEYDSSELTQEKLDIHFDKVLTLSRYAQISPIMGYLSMHLSRIEYVTLEDLDKGIINEFEKIRDDFKKLIDDIHDSSSQRVGITTYNMLKDKTIRESLVSDFDFLWRE